MMTVVTPHDFIQMQSQKLELSWVVQLLEVQVAHGHR